MNLLRFIHSYFQSFAYLFVSLFIHSNNTLIYSFMYSFSCLIIHLRIDFLINSFTHLFIHRLVCHSFSHSIIRSSLYSFTHYTFLSFTYFAAIFLTFNSFIDSLRLLAFSIFLPWYTYISDELICQQGTTTALISLLLCKFFFEFHCKLIQV